MDQGVRTEIPDARSLLTGIGHLGGGHQYDSVPVTADDLGGCAGVTSLICQTNSALDYCIPTGARESEPQVPTRTPLFKASPLDRSGLWSPKDENQTS